MTIITYNNLRQMDKIIDKAFENRDFEKIKKLKKDIHFKNRINTRDVLLCAFGDSNKDMILWIRDNLSLFNRNKNGYKMTLSELKSDLSEMMFRFDHINRYIKRDIDFEFHEFLLDFGCDSCYIKESSFLISAIQGFGFSDKYNSEFYRKIIDIEERRGLIKNDKDYYLSALKCSLQYDRSYFSTSSSSKIDLIRFLLSNVDTLNVYCTNKIFTRNNYSKRTEERCRFTFLYEFIDNCFSYGNPSELNKKILQMFLESGKIDPFFKDDFGCDIFTIGHFRNSSALEIINEYVNILKERDELSKILLSNIESKEEPKKTRRL